MTTHHYPSSLGQITLTAEGGALTGLYLPAHRRQFEDNPTECPAITAAVRWLDEYFAGSVPSFLPPMDTAASAIATAFRREVWELLLAIPHGKASTYGALARTIATRRGLARMSAQAVGGAVGANPISIIV
ncbi:MAG: MGMT family protein, partial [Oscillospiraceae bacterium]|nr:MGMT family protein [Oscillospiraceae bacterium]